MTIEHRPNKNAVRTQWGWSDKRTGEVLVAAYGYFEGRYEADQPKPNAPIPLDVGGEFVIDDLVTQPAEESSGSTRRGRKPKKPTGDSSQQPPSDGLPTGEGESEVHLPVGDGASETEGSVDGADSTEEDDSGIVSGEFPIDDLIAPPAGDGHEEEEQ